MNASLVKQCGASIAAALAAAGGMYQYDVLAESEKEMALLAMEERINIRQEAMRERDIIREFAMDNCLEWRDGITEALR